MTSKDPKNRPSAHILINNTFFKDEQERYNIINAAHSKLIRSESNVLKKRVFDFIDQKILPYINNVRQ